MKRSDRLNRQDRAHGWLAHMLWGLSSIVLGFLLLTRPVMTGLLLVQFMAVYWLVGGVIDIVHAVFARDKGWGWNIAGGIVGILAGLVILGHPLIGAALTAATLFMLAAFTAIFSGVTNILGCRSQAGKSWSWGRFFLGVLQVIVGIFMLWHPILGTLTFTTALGLVAIVGGLGSIGLAFHSRSRKSAR